MSFNVNDIETRTPVGYSQLTSLSSEVGLGTIPTGAKGVWIQAETQNIRMRDDGTNPTASVGFIIYAGQAFFYNGDLSAVKLIETTASAKANLLFYAD